MHSKRVVTGDLDIEKQIDDLLSQDSPTGLSPGDSKMDSPTELSPSDPKMDSQTELSTGDSKMESSTAQPLTSLQSIVLSMDWEINDPILKEFLQELTRLKVVFQQDGIVVKSLQLLESLGNYILKKKAKTHPDAIRLLQSIYRDLEILLLSKEISEAVRRNILVDEVAQFKKLKKKLALPFKPMIGYPAEESEIATTSPGRPSPEPAVQPKIISDEERVPTLEAVLYALEEIIRFIRLHH